MRADLEQRPGEDDLDWLTRLHGMVSQVAVGDTDPEVIAILLNEIPRLISQVRSGQMTTARADWEEYGGPKKEGT